MAGFDFEVPTIPGERPIAKALAHYIQVEARQYGCTMRYTWKQPNQANPYYRYYVTMDGSMPSIQTLLVHVMDITPAFVKGFVAGSATVGKAKIGEVFAIAFAKATFEFASDLLGLVDELHGYRVSVQPNSFLFECSEDPVVGKVLSDLTRSLILYESGRVGVEQLAEQLHTSAEILLKKNLAASNRGLTFAQLVDDAGQRGWLSQEQCEALNTLKDLRHDAKHRGQRIPDAKLDRVMNSILAACHTLSSKLRIKARHNTYEASFCQETNFS